MPKCTLLLPRGHPLLLEDLACFEGVKGSSEFLRGMRFAGAPIGHDDFCDAFVGQKVDEALAKCRALRGIYPQVGVWLLRKLFRYAGKTVFSVCGLSASSHPSAP